MAKNGMAGGSASRMSRASLSQLPNARTTYAVNFDTLDGGLNIYDLDYRLNNNESPDIRNLHWRDGALGSRLGQSWQIHDELGEGFACYSGAFWGCAFFHIDDKIYCRSIFAPAQGYEVDPDAAAGTSDVVTGEGCTLLYTGVPKNRGTFFRYGDYLMYKNRGAYLRIGYNPYYNGEGSGDSSDISGDITHDAFETGSEGTEGSDGANNEGEVIGPVLDPDDHENWETGPGGAPPDRRFFVREVPAYVPITHTGMNPTTHAGIEYQPENRLSPYKTLWYSAEKGVQVYNLPVDNVEEVIDVTVDGVPQIEGTDYEVNLEEGYVAFVTAPPVSEPYTANTVRLTYKKTNEDAYKSVMDCPYAIVYGGDQSLCVVMGGCSAQPNAYFWNGNHSVMDAGYFPMEQYNLAGDTEEEITAFGRQQNVLVIFKARSIGRAEIGTTTTSVDSNARVAIEMPYTSINPHIGCDLPWSVQLVQNNLVFCNTEQGVYMIADTSSAQENNVIQLSRKINGGLTRYGLLHDVREASPSAVCSFDFDGNYWIVANGHAYLWDYNLSAYNAPSWFYYTNINCVALFSQAQKLGHLNKEGRLTVFEQSFNDYGEGIDKVYQFATQNLGGYDHLKDVRNALFVVRSDTDTVTQILYETDYEKRYDLTPIRSFAWKLVPRNLMYRFLGINNFAHVEKRMPMCRHIRHFAMRLENNVIGQDLSVISAQIFYVYRGRER